jgi:hypothetical protein
VGSEECFLSGRTMVMVGSTGRQMIVYPISRRHEVEGKALINGVGRTSPSWT